MYIDLTFREWFIGKRKNQEQALEFPRIEKTITPDIVPLHIENACCECACQLAQGVDLYAGNYAQVKKSKVDVIEEEFFQVTNVVRTGNYKIEGMISNYLRRKNAIKTVSYSGY